MALELESLTKSIATLSRALEATDEAEQQALSGAIQETIQAGVIQNFEVCYELCWKMMKRWLEENMGSSEVDGVARRELFRLAAESRLIADVEQWMEYHKARNNTSHTYDIDTAQDVFLVAKGFIHVAKRFSIALEERNS